MDVVLDEAERISFHVGSESSLDGVALRVFALLLLI